MIEFQHHILHMTLRKVAAALLSLVSAAGIAKFASAAYHIGTLHLLFADPSDVTTQGTMDEIARATLAILLRLANALGNVSTEKLIVSTSATAIIVASATLMTRRSRNLAFTLAIALGTVLFAYSAPAFYVRNILERDPRPAEILAPIPPLFKISAYDLLHSTIGATASDSNVPTLFGRAAIVSVGLVFVIIMLAIGILGKQTRQAGVWRISLTYALAALAATTAILDIAAIPYLWGKARDPMYDHFELNNGTLVEEHFLVATSRDTVTLYTVETERKITSTYKSSDRSNYDAANIIQAHLRHIENRPRILPP
jgi:hypothetical protein